MTVCPRCRKKKEKETSQLCRKCQRLSTNKCHYEKKRRVIEILGGKCVDCGLTLEGVDYCHNIFDVHEISGIIEDKGKFRESALSCEMIRKIQTRYLNGEIILLCRNDHAKRHFKKWLEQYSPEELEFLGFPKP